MLMSRFCEQDLCKNFKNLASNLINPGLFQVKPVTNPQSQQINAITIRSGKTLEEPSIPLVPTPDVSNPQNESNMETSTEKVKNPNLENTAHVPPPGEEDSIFMEIPNPKAKKTINVEIQDLNSPRPNSYQSRLPYPERMKVREHDKPNNPFSGSTTNTLPPSSSSVKTSDNLEKFADELAPLELLPSETNKDSEIKFFFSFTLTSPEESELETYLERDSIPPGIDPTRPPTFEVSSSNPTSPTLTGEKEKLKENISSVTLLVFKEPLFLLPPPEPPDECLKNVVLNFYQNQKTFPLNVEDVNSFTFIIWTFLLHFTYTKESPLIFSFRSENFVFDPGIITFHNPVAVSMKVSICSP
ncbi:hypothetical protein Tco_0988418 [Tanacetum coccineum]|uniref:Uncharacterized protein n=1 Tax=Tanacetum coccineum TaxID=301880 RepID=A0ABQ5ER88_9ASTR